MADGDDQFTRGVQDGFDDAPVYRWQDPFHQERYETGYTLGRWQRVTQALDRDHRTARLLPWESWEQFEAEMNRRGLSWEQHGIELLRRGRGTG